MVWYIPIIRNLLVVRIFIGFLGVWNHRIGGFTPRYESREADGQYPITWWVKIETFKADSTLRTGQLNHYDVARGSPLYFRPLLLIRGGRCLLCSKSRHPFESFEPHSLLRNPYFTADNKQVFLVKFLTYPSCSSIREYHPVQMLHVSHDSNAFLVCYFSFFYNVEWKLGKKYTLYTLDLNPLRKIYH